MIIVKIIYEAQAYRGGEQLVVGEQNNTSVLLEIRQEYRDTKKQLEQYDRFIDRHRMLTLGAPTVVSILGILICGVGMLVAPHITVLVFLFLFLIITIVLITVSVRRNSAKMKLEKQMERLKREAVAYYRHTSGEANVTRDELGLLYDIEHSTARSHQSRIVVVALCVVIASIVAIPTVIHQVTTSRAKEQYDRETVASQSQCLDRARDTYQKLWDQADKDHDGDVSYKDGASDITISYYNTAIDCYRILKTEDSQSIIADYKEKRSQEESRYKAWLESLKQPTPSVQYAPPRLINCTSSTTGDFTHTSCY